MDAASIAGAYQGIKAAKEILTGLFEAKVDAEAKPKIIEAQSRLGEVQDALFLLREQLFQLQDEKTQLQAQLAAVKSWSARLEQYELSRTQGGAIVYRSKRQPEHFACPSCVNKEEIHVLQDNRTVSGKFRCTGCGCEYPIEPRKHVPTPIVRTKW